MKKNTKKWNATLGCLILLVVLVILSIFSFSTKKNKVKYRELYAEKLVYAEELLVDHVSQFGKYKRLNYDVRYNDEGEVAAIIIEYNLTDSKGKTIIEKYQFNFNSTGVLIAEKIK